MPMKYNQKRRKIMNQMSQATDFITCCSICRKIKDTDGGWQKISSTHYARIFGRLTHGYCDFCFKEVLQDITMRNN